MCSQLALHTPQDVQVEQPAFPCSPRADPEAAVSRAPQTKDKRLQHFFKAQIQRAARFFSSSAALKGG